MDKEKDIELIKKLKKLSDEDNYILRRTYNRRKEISFLTVLLFAIFYFPVRTATTSINHGTTIGNFNIVQTAFIVFYFTAFAVIIPLVLIFFTVLIIDLVLNRKDYCRGKEIITKLKGKEK